MSENEVTARQQMVIIEARELLRACDYPVDEMSDAEVLASVVAVSQELILVLENLLTLLEMITQHEPTEENETGLSC